MDQNSKTLFRSEFIDILMVSQEEVTRANYNSVFDIIILKNLIYFSKSNIKDFFQFTGTDWNSVNNAIQKQIELYVKENNVLNGSEKETEQEAKLTPAEEAKIKEVKESTLTDMIDWKLINNYVNLSSEAKQTISNAVYYSYDEEYIGEIEYILALLEEGFNTYVEGFFRSLNVDTRLVKRYFEGLSNELNSMEYATKHRIYEQNENVDDEDEDDEDDIPVYEYDYEPDVDSLTQAQQEDEKNDNLKTEKKSEKNKIVISPFLQGFLSFVKVDTGKESPIRQRDEETLAIMKILLKSKKSNAILVGKPGVGKTAIVEHLTWLINTSNCPEELKNKQVISLDVNAIIAGAKYVGMAEQRFNELVKFLKRQKDVILFIDEIHTIVGAGSYENNTTDLANALKPILARGDVAVIGATTEVEYNNWLSKDKALKRRFEKVVVNEPEYSEIYSMIKLQVENLKQYHGVKISYNIVDFIIKVAGCFNIETANPDRTLDLIDKAMASAKMQGKKTVTKDIVMSNFDANFKIFNKMSKELKYQIAYHELGHFLVRKFSKHIAIVNVLAISIVPYDSHLGVTVHDIENENIISWNYDAHLEVIATFLAGRAAETFYSAKFMSGAENDLKEATKEAKRMVMEYGFLPSFSKRNVQEDRYDKQTEDLNHEIDKIIDEGYKLAKSILKEHIEYLEELADVVVKKGFVVGTELDAICRNIEKRIKEKKKN